MKTRSPICTFLGHVDHGKSSILDSIRETAIVASEPGAITQCISCSKIDLNIIKKISGDLINQLKTKITLPGLLFIDTPGHAAFTNLRKRGGNLADIAVLVIDINEGIMPQTAEAIDILKTYKTPFIVALNKLDLISGWQSKRDSLLNEIKSQNERTLKNFDNKFYTILAKLHELGFNSERFDRIEDYTKQIALIPCSAKTKQGIPELLMILLGLAQKYLENKLKIEVKGPAHGTILEVKEEKGKGTTVDTIIYDGTIRINDTIVIGSLEEPIVTKVRALFDNQKSIKEAFAATGIKISAPNLEEVISGMPLKVANKNLEQVKKEIQKEVEEVIIETDDEGIIIKADSLGSLEALTKLLKEKQIKIKRASIGDISKKDIAEALTEKNPLNKIILGFNVKSDSKEVKIITSNIIYHIIEEFEKWQDKEKKKIEAKALEKLTTPCKIQILEGYVFRQSNPAIVGVKVLAGKLKLNMELIKEDKTITQVREIQHEKENIQEAEEGKEVAIALTNVTIGRQIKEDDILYSDIKESDFQKLKKLKNFLNRKEQEVLKEIVLLKRKLNPLWGL